VYLGCGFVIGRNDDDIDVETEHRADPGCELAVKPDVDRSGHVRCAERILIANVKDDRATLDLAEHVVRRERRERFELVRAGAPRRLISTSRKKYSGRSCSSA